MIVDAIESANAREREALLDHLDLELLRRVPEWTEEIHVSPVPVELAARFEKEAERQFRTRQITVIAGEAPVAPWPPVSDQERRWVS